MICDKQNEGCAFFASTLWYLYYHLDAHYNLIVSIHNYKLYIGWLSVFTYIAGKRMAYKVQPFRSEKLLLFGTN